MRREALAPAIEAKGKPIPALELAFSLVYAILTAAVKAAGMTRKRRSLVRKPL